MIQILKNMQLFSYSEMIENDVIRKNYINKQQVDNVDWIEQDLNESLHKINEEIKEIDNLLNNKNREIASSKLKRYIRIKYKKYLIREEYNISGVCYDDDFIGVIIDWLLDNDTTYYLKHKLNNKYNSIYEKELAYQNSEKGILERTDESFYFDLEGDDYDLTDFIAISNIYIHKNEQLIK